MKRYALFAGDTYYPSGGWYDFRGSFDSFEEALAASKEQDYDWYHIVNLNFGRLGR
jgi:hypothetical protein